MILSDSKILEALAEGALTIDPFQPDCLGSNSYDVHLGNTLGVYQTTVLDARRHNAIDYIPIPEEGYVLLPGIGYLGVTQEYTETHGYVPWLDGKSSVGRLFIDIHATAGRGDAGFCGCWTLEISVVHPVRVYAGMPIGQLSYFLLQGEVLEPYGKKQGAKYADQGPFPVESRMYQNSF